MRIINSFNRFWFVKLRILKFRLLSDCTRVFGSPSRYQPVLLKGKGQIKFGDSVQIGVIASSGYYSSYAYIEARNENSEVIFGDNVSINNNFSTVAYGKIMISNGVLIGVNCSIVDNDGHNLDAAKRLDAVTDIREVFVGENVFLGDNVTILKGVSIGRNSVIGSRSIVTKNIPENVVAAGNPATVIKRL